MQERGGRELQEKKKENEDEGGGKTVLVGIKMDADSRELLTWSLVKIADAGDRVFALHVLPSTPSGTTRCSRLVLFMASPAPSDHLTAVDSSDASLGCSSLLSIVKAFDAMLAVYEGFCNLKQVAFRCSFSRSILSLVHLLPNESHRGGAR